MVVVRCLAAAGFCIALLGLSACSTEPTHLTLVSAAKSGELPSLVPLRRFVANLDDVGGFVLSPDGAKLVWQLTAGPDSGLAMRCVYEQTVTRFATGFLSRPNSAGPTYGWLPDSRHLAHLRDFNGNENT